MQANNELRIVVNKKEGGDEKKYCKPNGAAHTFLGFAISMTWVIAEGGRNGLCAGKSDPEGVCSLSLHVCKKVLVLLQYV